MRRLLVTVAAVALAHGAARAAPPPGRAGFESDHFHPSDTANGWLSIDSAFTAPHLGFTAGLYATWAHDVLVERGGNGAVVYPSLSNQLGLDLAGSLALFERLELGVDLPIVPYQAVLLDGAQSAGVGDLRLDLKVRLATLARGTHRVGFAFIGGVRLPTGDEDSFLGQGGASGWERVAIEWMHPRGGIAVDLGVVLRGERTYGDLDVTHQFAWGLAGHVHAVAGLDVMATLSGLVGLGTSPSLTAAEAPLELLAGARWRFPFGLSLTLAGGPGLTRGYGTPDGRLVLGAYYQAPPRKRKQPSAPLVIPVEDDADHDGVRGARDHCPTVPGPLANAGCPDEDSDGDGVIDRLDGCPMTKGDPQQHGCPEPDQDHDGVPDDKDRCPEQAGSPDNDGCPDIDSDGDGLIDRLDKCPFDAETYNGNADEDGCPDAGPVLAELQPDKIVLKERIGWNGVKLEPRSLKILGVVARLLTLHPEITRLRIEGHTDDRGSAIDNLDLSLARAVMVRRTLIDQFGIAPKRLFAQGFGPDRPIYDNRDPGQRAKNNRIELIIVEKKAPNSVGEEK